MHARRRVLERAGKVRPNTVHRQEWPIQMQERRYDAVQHRKASMHRRVDRSPPTFPHFHQLDAKIQLRVRLEQRHWQ